jgi:hypothetical protein
MFVPIILGSDKTTVSVGTGDTAYYPLYLSIGNTQNKLRRAHRNAVALIAFLAIPKGKLYVPSSPAFAVSSFVSAVPRAEADTQEFRDFKRQ